MVRQGYQSDKPKSTLSVVLNFHDPLAFGRLCILGSSMLFRVVSDLSAGAIYMAFLAAHNFSIVQVGVIVMLPLLASCFSILSPLILEPFQRRRWILNGARLLYHTLNLLGTSVLPWLVHDEQALYSCFCVLVFSAAVINNLTTSGYNVWHLNFLEEDLRAQFFSYQQLFMTVFYTVVIYGFTILADSFSSSPYYADVLAGIRLFGFVLALGDVVFLSLPKEFSYAKTERIRFLNVFRLPIRRKKFLITVMIMALWGFSCSLPSSAWPYYLIRTVGTGTTMLNTFTMSYSVSLIVLSGFCIRMIQRYSWFRAFAVSAILNGITVLAASFVTGDNYRWLYPATHILLGVIGVGLNISFANLVYIHIARENQTYYIAFQIFVCNCAAFLGQAFGTAFVNWMGSSILRVGGLTLYPAQLLLMLQGILMTICGSLIFLLLSHLKSERI